MSRFDSVEFMLNHLIETDTTIKYEYEKVINTTDHYLFINLAKVFKSMSDEDMDKIRTLAESLGKIDSTNDALAIQVVKAFLQCLSTPINKSLFTK